MKNNNINILINELTQKNRQLEKKMKRLKDGSHAYMCAEMEIINNSLIINELEESKNDK